MRTFVVCAAFAVLVQPADMSAQVVPLTEAEVLAQLGDENPLVMAVRAGAAVARADILAAARWPNPRVTFSREAVAGIAEGMFMVSQALPITGRRGLDVNAATARADASSLRADDQIRRVRADLRLAFTDLWVSQQREAELRRSGDALRELAAILAKREAAGDASGFDRLRAEREVIDVDASRASAASARAQAQVILSSFLTRAADPLALQAVAPAPSSQVLPSVEELVARAETARGDLAALARDIDAAGFAEQAAGRRPVPEPEVVAGTKSSTAAGGDVGSIFSVHLTVPIFDRATPERAAAQARGQQLRAEVRRRSVRAQIAAWRVAVIERRAVAERHRAALGSAADQIQRIAQVSYEAGERGILELLDAFRTASTAHLRQTELDASVRQAEIELEFASGWEIR
jgi:cobalt-zinc-cadmium efflux system outer membrane protein